MSVAFGGEWKGGGSDESLKLAEAIEAIDLKTKSFGKISL